MNYGVCGLRQIARVSIAIVLTSGSFAAWAKSSAGPKIEATGFTWDPASPEIGQLMTLEITGHIGDIRAEWNFGENGCAGYPQIQVCEPFFSNCHDFAFKFASGGAKNVSVTVKDPNTGSTLGSISKTINVQNVGSCAGEPTCTYSLNPAQWSFPAEGGNLTVSVVTQPGCDWNATTVNPWITLNTPTNGTGSGSVSYVVAANAGVSRTGAVSIENQTHSVFQLGCAVSAVAIPDVFSWQGGPGIVTVSADQTCEWVASSPGDWITFASPTVGVGSATVAFDVAVDDGEGRSSEIRVGNEVLSILQEAAGPCGRGDVPDDGSAENGYGWGTGNIFVQRFTPDAYPFVYTDVCTAFTQAGGDTVLSFESWCLTMTGREAGQARRSLRCRHWLLECRPG